MGPSRVRELEWFAGGGHGAKQEFNAIGIIPAERLYERLRLLKDLLVMKKGSECWPAVPVPEIAFSKPLLTKLYVLEASDMKLFGQDIYYAIVAWNRNTFLVLIVGKRPRDPDLFPMVKELAMRRCEEAYRCPVGQGKWSY